MLNKRIAIHVGLPKCGSTYLQNVFFPGHSEIDYLGPFHGNSDADDLWRYLMKTSERDWDSVKACRLGEAAFTSTVDGAELKLLSRENIGIDGEVSVATKAERLRGVFHNAQIIIVVREPVALVESSYLQYAKGFGAKYSYVSVADWWDQQDSNGNASSVRARLQYQKLADIYSRHYGKKCVCVLKFEEFAHDPAAFFDSLCGFLGVSMWDRSSDGNAIKVVNPRLSEIDLIRSRFSTGLSRAALSLARAIVPPGLRAHLRDLVSRPATAEFPDRIRGNILEIYCRENGEFARQWGIDYLSHT